MQSERDRKAREDRVRRELADRIDENPELGDEMLARTHIPEAPWWGGESNNKRRARLNCIHHLLRQIPYKDVEHQPIVLPRREHKPDYARMPVAPELYVPAVN